ncbi:hypothetical protein LCL90_13935 [Bacillus infantis]|uniref:hypothetical protein n=1 Tax=Bacillus infantis TaxID=324767 RepID=UPI001CD1C3FA|nr:hypothetical protein [Bacillus infantis]MCA1035734.1 hypothetical protein [Bacillus infantis]
MKRLFAFLFITIILLTACQSKTLYFEGASQNWYGKIRVIQTEDTQEQNFTLKYEGSNLKSITGKEIKYRIESEFGITEGMGTLSNGGVLQSQDFGYMCSGCAFIQQNTVITMTVEWDEETESIELKKE